MLTLVYLCLLVFTYLYPCLVVFTYVYHYWLFLVDEPGYSGLNIGKHELTEVNIGKQV